MYFKNFLARYLIFKPWISAILIAILITVDLVYVAEVGFEPSGEGTDKEKQKSLVSRYLTFQKVIRRVYVVLVLLCSFTFFGNALLGQKIARVQVRITKIRSGYEQVEKATEAALTAAVQQRLLDEIDNSIAFTRPYLAQPLAHPHRYYHDIIYTSHDRIESLRKSYSTAKSTAAVNLGPNLDARVNEVTSKPPPAYDGPREVPYSDIARGTDGVTETPSQVETHPANLKELTSGKLTEINKALQDTSKVRKSVSAIKLADGTEILIQLPKSFTNVAKGAAFRTLIARFPFLEPIIDALVSAFDKTVEQRIKAKVGPKLDSLLARWFPGETLSQADFQYEAGTIVNESNVTVSETVIKDTKAAAHEYTESIADSDQLIKEVDNRIETARVHNEPPPETVLSSGDTLPEATCAKSALDNYRTRLQRAKTSGERMEAAIKYESDLARLREREFLPGFKPG